MKRIRLFLMIVMAFALLSGCIKEKQVTESAPIQVEVMNVTSSADATYQTYVGTIEAEISSALSFSVPGNVTKIYVSEGDYVTEGQLLAELDEQSYIESLNMTNATLSQAQDAYDRLKPLHEQGSITEIQWVEVETKYAQAKAMKTLAEKNVNHCKLKAPFSGIIGNRSIEIGNNIVSGFSAFTLLNISKVDAKIAIPENIISSINIGQKAVTTVSAIGNKQFEGKVGTKGVLAHPLTHCYEVLIPLNNNSRDLRPGMVCKVQLLSAPTNDILVLPNKAVKISYNEEKYVWLAIEGVAQKRTVETGGLADDGIIITNGLTIGDKVIIKGEHKLSEGSKITVLNE